MRILQHRVIAFVVAAVCGIWIAAAYPFPVHVLDLDRLTKDSDLIIVGEIVALQQAGHTSVQIGSQQIAARAETADLKIDRVLKVIGTDVAPSEVVKIHLYAPDQFVGWPSARLHFYGVYFLKVYSPDTIGFTDPVYPFAPALAESRVSGELPIDRVINEVAGFLYTPGVPLNDSMAALAYVARSRSKAAMAVLKSALASESKELQYIAAASLLERNDISGLPIAKVALLGVDVDADNLIENMANAIGLGLKDPKAVDDLSQLLTARSIIVRRNAALALMRTQAKEAVRSLLHALRDPDAEVSYYGAVGLAEIVGQPDWRPSMEEFQSNRSKYLKHWAESERAQPR